LKSVANFYSIEENHDVKLCICKLVRNLFKKEENIIIIDSSDKLVELDKLLWSFEQNSFLPHKIYSDGDAIDTPIMLLSIQNLDKLKIFNNYTSVINNFDNALLKLNDNTEIYEFVGSSELNKSISRKKFLEYKKNSFTLIHNKYNEQTI
jgi:DNA polymerase-3 subunit chi|tara:strand:+ start:469 stop:918 length:450 start_codon:yes stop_codon:yes gene_type:complete